MKDAGIDRPMAGHAVKRVIHEDQSERPGVTRALDTTSASREVRGDNATGTDALVAPLAVAPDAGHESTPTVSTDQRPRATAQLGLRTQTTDDAKPWQPDLRDRTRRGLARFSPVSTPWAATFDEALTAARNVRPLPNLSASVRQAERTFRAMVQRDPEAVAQAYIGQVKVSRARIVARIQSTIKAQLSEALEKVDRRTPNAVIGAAEHALHQVQNMKPGRRAKLLQSFSDEYRQTGDFKRAVGAMLSAVHVPLKIETDEIKLMSPHFNGTKVNLSDSVYEGADAAKIGPAVFNTALHPTATAVARVALELLLRETEGPLVVMAGGVAAGKGFAAQKANFDDSDAAIVFDPDGESSQTFMDTVDALGRQYGNEVRLVGVVTDPVAAWLRAVNRSFEEGRTVSETAFSHSHSTGVENMITTAQRMRAQGRDAVLIDNNTWPKLYDGAPPSPMGLQETYGRIKDITDALDETGQVPAWVREIFGDNDYMMKHVIEPLESKMQDPKRLQERKAIFDSLKEDRHVFEYAHPKV